MGNKSTRCLAVVALALAASLVAFASNAQDKKRLKAETITYYPPFSFKDPATNELRGFDHDVLNAIAAKMDAEVDWSESSFDQLISFASLKTRRADIYATAMGDTPGRRATASFLDYVYEPMVFYTLKNNASAFTNLVALCGRRVAVTRSSAVMNDAAVKWSEENCVKSGKPAIKVESSENAAQSQLMLDQKRVDVAISGAGSLAYQKTVQDRYVTLGGSLVKVMYGMAFPKENEQFGRQLKNALNGLIADGTYAQLLHKWGLPQDASIGEAMINGER